ncbi:hypothetical protein EDD77_13813 [Allofournierella massiliensis]|uniref:Uncharacterized protein n=2 Tax=Allofournierella massiliensis TaxID=1650663 RepID=A0A4R1QJF8_9FIRM|nr:hypothetical protein EDD77_13813 [Fournierella massiliensis]
MSEKVGENMTRDEAKTRLERYTGLRLEVRIRLERLATLQQMDRERPSPCGSRSEEYAREIAPIVQANRREMAEIEAAVAALPDPLEREVLRLRYLEFSKDPRTGKKSVRHITWKEIGRIVYGDGGKSGQKSAQRHLERAISYLATIWPESGQ